MALEKKLNEVIVLNEGYSYMEQDDDSVMIANCTCTLIKSHDCNIIVDTMTPWDSDLLLQSEYMPIPIYPFPAKLGLVFIEFTNAHKHIILNPEPVGFLPYVSRPHSTMQIEFAVTLSGLWHVAAAAAAAGMRRAEDSQQKPTLLITF